MKLSRPVLAHKEIWVTGGMVVAQHPLGARTGAEVLERGGNAIDAAVTTAFAMGVLQPYMNGLGGGGQMVIHPPDVDPAVVYYGMQAPRLHVETDAVLMDGRFGPGERRALEKKGHTVEMATPHFDRSPYAEPNGVWRDGRTLRSGVYPVAKPTYAAGYPGGDDAPPSGAEWSAFAPRPDLYPPRPRSR